MHLWHQATAHIMGQAHGSKGIYTGLDRFSGLRKPVV